MTTIFPEISTFPTQVKLREKNISFCGIHVGQILAERTPLAQRQSVKENEYMCHVYVRADGLVGVCVSDEEYQTRVAHSLITKILDDFAGQGRINSFLKAPFL